jgi:hypothetical protein
LPIFFSSTKLLSGTALRARLQYLRS